MKIFDRLEEIRTMVSKTSLLKKEFKEISLRITEIKEEFNISISLITIKDINEVVRYYFNLKKDYHLINTRKRQLVLARQFSMIFMLKYTKNTQEEIGEFFMKDHSTVIHARKTIRDLRETDRDILKHYSKIDSIIQIKFIV